MKTAPLQHELNIEEFKYASDRKKLHESVHVQMLLFCLTSFGTILGFSEKINQLAIPYALVIILHITSKVGNEARISYAYNAAFLYEILFKEQKTYSYESLFFKWITSNRKKDWMFKIRLLIAFCFEPNFILLVVSVVASYFFARPVMDLQLYISLPYVVGLTLFILYIIRSQIKIYKYDYDYFIDMLKNKREP